MSEPRIFNATSKCFNHNVENCFTLPFRPLNDNYNDDVLSVVNEAFVFLFLEILVAKPPRSQRMSGTKK